MKTILLLSVFALSSAIALSNKVIVTNTGFTFTPDSISVHSNDTVVFQLEAMHNVAEVTEATWFANDFTPLPGGFTLPFGGGELTGLTVGLHYYVCQPHSSLGMKGRIFVTSGLGIAPPGTAGNISIYPNPTDGKFSFAVGASAVSTGLVTADVYNLLGIKILSQTGLEPRLSYEIDLTAFPDGIYFLRITDGLKANTVRILKR
jgi:plastocyanin